MTNSWTVRLLVSDEEVRAPDVRAAWETLIQNSNNIDLLFQSPIWLDHLRATDHDSQTVLAVLERPGDGIAGIVPLRLANYSLRYDVSGHILWRDILYAASMLGSQPFLPLDESVFSALCAAVRSAHPECQGFLFNSVPVESPLWALLHRLKNAPSEKWVAPHRILDVRRHHLIRLPATSADYMARFQGRSRKGLRRHLRSFETQPGAAPALLRVESPEQVEDFMERRQPFPGNPGSMRISAHASSPPPGQRRKLLDLAERGVLRAYLLRHGETPCTFSLGYQYRDVFHDFEIGYNRDFAHHSPGTVLLLRMIEDLIQHRPPRFYNFDLGDAPYKANFSTEWYEDASLLLARDTPGNWLRVAMHGAFRRSRGWLNNGRAAYKSMLLRASCHPLLQAFLMPVEFLQERPIPSF